MATAHPSPGNAAPPALATDPQWKAAGAPAVEAIPASVPEREQGAKQLSGPVARLPVELDIAVPVREFRVRHLLALEPGEVIESQWSYGQDLALAVGAVQLAWSEFEVIDSQLAVRITRLP